MEGEISRIRGLLAERSNGGDSGVQAPATAISPDLDTPASTHPEPERPIREEILDLFDLEASIAAYRKLSAEHFPYVVLSDEYSASWLARNRPMLSLAIGIATTWKDQIQQSRIRKVFLQQLSVRYFFKHERSLDLLQALLVFATW